MHNPDSRWPPCCQGKSRDDVSGSIIDDIVSFVQINFYLILSTAVL